MIRIFLIAISTLFAVLSDTEQANAFFTQNYKKQMLYGAFKQSYNTDLYLGVRIGFLLHPWTPNITTAVSPKNEELNSYTSIIPDLATKKTTGSWAYSVGVDIGLHVENSKFRHEMNFEWYGVSSTSRHISSNDEIVVNGNSYNYAIINNKMIASIGTYADIYKVGYSLHYNFENAFSLLKANWDVFLSIGAGFAFINGGTYIGSEIKRNSSSETSTSSYTRSDNKVSDTTQAKKNILTKTKSFGVACNAKVGIIANISQSFAASLALSFGATSRPLLTTKFSSIPKSNGVRSLLEYHIAIEIGMLLKAFEIAL